MISWAPGNDSCGKCKGKLQTDLHYETLSKTDRSCVPKLAGMGVKVKLGNCRKRAREDVPVPVPIPVPVPMPYLCLSMCLCLDVQFIRNNRLYAKGCDMVNEIPKYWTVSRTAKKSGC